MGVSGARDLGRGRGARRLDLSGKATQDSRRAFGNAGWGLLVAVSAGSIDI